MKISGKNPIANDVASLKKMTVIERKTNEMALLKTSFDAASKNGVLRVQNAFTVKQFIDK
ncbi:hypothetical protein [Pectobacterium versatile]|uniref:hypothetical protein n=1 Tax=Pectobacterium versatile TaxID=2488639 RepID=UPI001CF276A2|nr:hypothetical protein [Pectobacterium versatile]MCA6924729.1 hypothetical protein [Pectobacterium versatile]MCH5081494.1 hypothetical protein [Pectobacterium versatile]